MARRTDSGNAPGGELEKALDRAIRWVTIATWCVAAAIAVVVAAIVVLMVR